MEIKNRRCIIEDLNKFDIMAEKMALLKYVNGRMGKDLIYLLRIRKLSALLVGN